MAGFPKGPNKLGEKAREPRPGVPVDKDLIIEFLRKFNGNISRTADKIGMSRYSLARRIDNDPELTTVKLETRERFIDTLEDCSWNKAVDGDTVMQLFLLKTIGKHRGYNQDSENTTQDIAKAAFDFVINRTKNPAE